MRRADKTLVIVWLSERLCRLYELQGDALLCRDGCKREMHALQVGGQLRQAVSSLESAKADNLALVERLRYVQGYRAQTRGKGNPWLQILLSFLCSYVPTLPAFASLCFYAVVVGWPHILPVRRVFCCRGGSWRCGEQVHKGV